MKHQKKYRIPVIGYVQVLAQDPQVALEKAEEILDDLNLPVDSHPEEQGTLIPVNKGGTEMAEPKRGKYGE